VKMKIKCPKCAEIFNVSRGVLRDYVYKTKTPLKYYCSYTCWRKAGGNG
jgi:hypothetical protein